MLGIRRKLREKNDEHLSEKKRPSKRADGPWRNVVQVDASISRFIVVYGAVLHVPNSSPSMDFLFLNVQLLRDLFVPI